MTKEKINRKIEGLLCGCILPCGQDARPLPSPSILPGVEQTGIEQTDMEQIGKEEISTLHKSESRITSSSC